MYKEPQRGLSVHMGAVLDATLVGLIDNRFDDGTASLNWLIKYISTIIWQSIIIRFIFITYELNP